MGITIKKQPLDTAEKMKIDYVNWGYDAFTPETYAQIVYDETGFTVKFTVKEKNPQCEKMEDFMEVSEDSCVELFINFDPEHSDYYLNIEVNAIGKMYGAFRTDRYNFTFLTLEEVKGLHIQTAMEEEQWTVTFHISLELLQDKYPGFTLENCKYVKGNLYQCGLCNQPEHYLSLFPVGTPTPDYHRPEYFGEIKVE